uniref:Biopterin-dependent aromatic amino acid hydroxylase family profile domain-containing protein n=1 Tax=Acrobeloides nanus TaxID=290746 RepID=A0A914BYH3_9BILA
MNPLFGRRDSLVTQASIDRVQNEELRIRTKLRHRRELERSISFKQLLFKLNDDGVELLKTASDLDQLRISMIVNSVGESLDVLMKLLKLFSEHHIQIFHIETRPDSASQDELEILVGCESKKSTFVNLITNLADEKSVDRIALRKWDAAEKIVEEIWFPKHASDLDNCAHVVVKYEPTEDPKHPGYGDEKYIARRAELNRIANSYKYGNPIPIVEYTEEEHDTWRQAYAMLKQLRPTHTCREYQVNIQRMEDAGVITPNEIPSLRDLSAYIQKRTGFELRPCGGLLSARDFLASLAFRVFQATLYVRHHSAPQHCPEPDVIHEILGHCPMFADPEMAQLSQEIGLLSLGASDSEIERLSTLYWFIIEFGLSKEADGTFKAIGAGLISAYGELQHACSDAPSHEPFDPEVTALRTYEDSEYQPVYFVAESIQDAMERLRKYAKSFKRSVVTVYNPYARTVEQVNRWAHLQDEVQKLRDKVNQLAEYFSETELAHKSPIDNLVNEPNGSTC